ncbi:MAG: DUF2298 domain-containing protein, partial [Chloroflexi bacterium]|nr:DUF2298 domain-containing protein [Chloroflexota bacterium]
WEWVGIEGMTVVPDEATPGWRPDEFWWWFRATRVINTFDEGTGLDPTIHEFPFFSSLLGDLHPHFMSLAFIPIFLMLMLQFFLSPLPDWRDGRFRTWLPILALAFVLGALGFINAWDLPIFALLLIGVIGLKAYSVHGRELKKIAMTTAPLALLILVVAFLMFSSYFVDFRSQFGGIQPVSVTTRPIHFIIVWGLTIVTVVPFVVAAFWTTVLRRGWGWMVRLAGVLVLLPFVIWGALHLWNNNDGNEIIGRFFHVLPFMFLLVLAIYTALSYRRPVAGRRRGLRLRYRHRTGEADWAATASELTALVSSMGGQVLWMRDTEPGLAFEAGLKRPPDVTEAQFEAEVARRFDADTPLSEMAIVPSQEAEPSAHSGTAFVIVLASLALFLVMVPELLYVRDFFGHRMNTVFKFYYQAWLLFAIVGGFAVYYWHSHRGGLQGWKRWGSNLWALAFVVLLLGTLYYVPAALASKAELSRGEATLDGLAYVADEAPGELAVIQYLLAESDRDTVLLTAVGGSYTRSARISSSSGVPTVLGWPQHQNQWRGSDEAFRGREDDVRRIYSTVDVEEAKNLMDKYNVEYVYVGPDERRVYGRFGTDKFASFMEPVLEEDRVVLYRRIQP